MSRDRNGLTQALWDALERVHHNPAADFRGPELALVNKLRRAGLVERRDYRLYATLDGRRILKVGLDDDTKEKIAKEIELMLHAHRDCLRNQKQDTGKVTFDVRDGYYGEAFGVMRCLKVLGYIDYGAVNVDGNAQSWMREIEQRVLQAENYGGSNECDHCLERYGKDGAGRRRSP